MQSDHVKNEDNMGKKWTCTYMEGCWGKLSSEVKQAVCRKAALNLVLKEMIVSGWAGGVEGISK